MQTPKPSPGYRPVRIAAVCLGWAFLTGCQSFTGISSQARLRVIDLSQDIAAVDVYHGSEAVAYNLSYGSVTSYVLLAPGTQAVTIDAAGSKQVLASARATISAGGQYTMLVPSLASGQPPILLTDRIPAVPGASSIRLVQQASHAGAVDIYVVPAGQRLASVIPIMANLAPGTNTGYLAVPPGLCTVVMLPAGASPSSLAVAMHTSTQVQSSGGSARTLILVDNQASLAPAIQVITTVDAESRE